MNKIMKITESTDDLLISFLSYLDLRDCLTFLSSCRTFYAKLKDPAFLEKIIRSLNFLTFKNLKITQKSSLPFFEYVYKNLYHLKSQMPQILQWLPMDASSTDKNQSIHNTLSEVEGFWGSVGFPDENQEVWALFDLGECCTGYLLSEVTIAFTHFYYVYSGGQTIGNPVYQSKYIQVELGFHPNKPVYTSKLIEVGTSVQIGDLLTVTVPIFPEVVFARYVRVRFVGLRNKHTLKDNMYYLCVDKILPKGYKLEKVDLDLIDNGLESYYHSKENDKVTEMIIEKHKDDDTYIRNIHGYNKELIAEVENLYVHERREAIVEVLNHNPQLKLDKDFFKYLIDRHDVADIYLENLFEKQMHLNFLETILVMNLSIDWSKMTLFDQSDQFLKNDKYFGMFWLYYFEEQKLLTYLDKLSESGALTAFDAVEEDSVDTSSKIELHGSLELKKIVYMTALKNYMNSQAQN